MRSAFLWCSAPGEFEITDARTPVKTGSGRVVFVRVVESAIVYRVNRDIGVVAPAIGSGALAARTVKKMLFA